MLQLIPCHAPEDKKSFLAQFEPQHHLWVVSDLQSKLEIKKSLLDRHQLIPDRSVVRASELWRQLLEPSHPHLQFVPQAVAEMLVQRFLKRREISWLKSSNASRQSLNHLTQLLPVLAQEDGIEKMQEWLQSKPEALLRWGHWVHLSRELYAEIQRLQVYLPEWIPALLLQESFAADLDVKKIYFDLGSALQPMEVPLMEELSKTLEVVVFQPSPEFKDQYEWDLKSYSYFSSTSLSSCKAKGSSSRLIEQEPFDENQQVHAEINSAESNTKPVYPAFFRRFTSCLAEVKDAVAQVRAWLDAGVDIESIAVIAPDIESYWPVLSPYLQQEGITVQKAEVVPLHSMPEMSQWVSRIKVALRQLRGWDIEASLFNEATRKNIIGQDVTGQSAIGQNGITRQVTTQLKYDQFKRLYANVYDADDLQRDKKIWQLFQGDQVPTGELDRTHALSWFLQYWPKPVSTDALHILVSRWLQEVPQNLYASCDQWFNLLTELLVRYEMKVEPACYRGVYATNLFSVQNLSISHLYVMGLSDQYLRPETSSSMTDVEAEQVFQDLGFLLPKGETSHPEFELAWALKKDLREVVLSTAETDWGGQALPPSVFWIRGAIHHGVNPEEVMIPQVTRWDELQRSAYDQVAEIRNWSAQESHDRHHRLNLDKGLNDSIDFAQKAFPTLSVSQLENYAKCPFVFAAQKIFKLSDLPDVDLDVDAMTKGKLFHAVFAQLTKPPFCRDWDESSLDQLLEQCRESEALVFSDAAIWTMLKKQHVFLAQCFLAQEQRWRTHHSDCETVGREVRIRAFWDIERAELVNEETPYPFTGSIDRIDRIKDRYIVIDYKSSAAKLRLLKTWLTNDDFQMALYTAALQKGFTELPATEVNAAVYMTKKSLQFEKGFKIDQDIINDEFTKSKLKPVTQQELDEALQAIYQRVNDLVKMIAAGRFAPKPKETKICKDCEWQRQCRAPHLNL